MFQLQNFNTISDPHAEKDKSKKKKVGFNDFKFL